MRYTDHFFLKSKKATATPQSLPIPGKEAVMVKNTAGGFVFKADDWKRLQRFLTLGTEGGSYYVSEKKLTIDNAKVVERCLSVDGLKTVQIILEVSRSGRAPKNSPAIFALAMAASSSDQPTRKAALEAMPLVCRTGTHLFEFAECVQSFRGWGRTLRNAMGSWYQQKDLDTLAYQLMKYKNRNGWTHRDVLRLAHPKTEDAARNLMYKWVTKPETALEGNNDAIVRLNASVIASKTKDVSQMVELIGKYDLPRETLNTELLNDVKVWKAMLDNGMPLTAMIRNLGKMTSIGLLSPNSAATLKVVETLTNVAFLKKARVHPISILVALKTYQQGHGEKGNLSWSPSSAVLEALNDAFYAAFDAIDSTGKRFYLGVDVSGSMSCGTIAGMTGITPRTAAAVMAMVTARVEKQKVIKGFSHNLVDIDISPRDSLETVISKMERIPMGGTDASLPIKDALKNKIPVDCFVTYTDNETWAGSQHTMEALKEYRQKMGIPAKLVVVGFTASPFTIGDPDDVSCLDVAGFDSATPNLIADFVVE
jgi:60 kDa SS-A/Ro ribonucleoprotein